VHQRRYHRNSAVEENVPDGMATATDAAHPLYVAATTRLLAVLLLLLLLLVNDICRAVSLPSPRCRPATTSWLTE